MIEEIGINFFEGTGFAGIGAAFIFLLFKYLNKKVDSIGNRKPIDHDFFKNANFLLLTKIDNIHFSEDGSGNRTIMFRDMLKSKIKIWKRHILEFVENKRYNDDDFEDSFIRCIKNTVDLYKEDWKNMGVPNVVIRKFYQWHNVHSEVLYNSIKSITEGNSYTKREEMMNALLDINNAMLTLTILDAEKTLKDLNGQISKLQYKGKYIG